jgi:hypothetical protein
LDAVLIIRSDQMKVLERCMMRGFEDRVYASLCRNWPSTVGALGEEDVRESIRVGIDRAATYRLQTEREVMRFIDMMYRLGHQFDRDTRYSFAAEVLSSRELSSVAKMRILESRVRANVGEQNYSSMEGGRIKERP